MTAKSHCPFCNSEITKVELRLKKSCGARQCQAAHRANQRRERETEEAIWNEKFRRRVAKAVTARDDSDRKDSASFLPIVTPANVRKLTRLPRRRKHRFLKRLLKLIDDLGVDSCPAPTPLENKSISESPLKIIGQACANCRGKCCQRGGTYAYLDLKTIEQFVTSHDFESKQQVVEAYFKRLPEYSYQGSCVFHGERGCTLTRAMRSATCNNTICGGVAELTARIGIDGASDFFLAAMSGEQVLRTRFTQNETTPDGDSPI